MYLTLNKRFEFAASYRYYQSEWTDEKNQDFFGRRAMAKHGFGGNLEAYFIFHGPVDQSTGMIINVTIIKQKINELLRQRYDHKFLNGDTKPFDKVIPTPENIAVHIFNDVRPLFEDSPAQLVACHLRESPTNEATAYADGRVERHIWTEFSAARRTRSPHLTEEENYRLFGMAASPSGHGHHYRLRITMAGDIDNESGMIVPDIESHRILKSFRSIFDHRNLNLDIADLEELPMTTECLARYMYNYIEMLLPVNRVRLWENPWFSVEYLSNKQFCMCVENTFRAAHRLHSADLSDQQNREVYDKCNNPRGHGHQYRVESTLTGNLDERSGALFPLGRFCDGVQQALDDWDYKHLDLDTSDFTDRPSTSENIIQVLMPRIEKAIDHSVHRLRLWETPNNRFTLRKNVKHQ